MASQHISSIHHEETLVMTSEISVSEAELQQMLQNIEKLEQLTKVAIKTRDDKISNIKDEIGHYRKLLADKDREISAMDALLMMAKEKIDPEATSDQSLCDLIEKERLLVSYHAEKRKEEYRASQQIVDSWAEYMQSAQTRLLQNLKENQAIKEYVLRRLLQLPPNPGQPLRPPGGFKRTVYDQNDSISDDEVAFTLQSKLSFFSQTARGLDDILATIDTQISDVMVLIKKEESIYNELNGGFEETQKSRNIILQGLKGLKSSLHFRYQRNSWDKHVGLLEVVRQFEQDIFDEFDVRTEEKQNLTDRILSIEKGENEEKVNRLYDECGKVLAAIISLNSDSERILAQIMSLKESSKRYNHQSQIVDEEIQRAEARFKQQSVIHRRNLITWQKLQKDLELLTAQENILQSSFTEEQENSRIITLAVEMIVECIRNARDKISLLYTEFDSILDKDGIVKREIEAQKRALEDYSNQESSSSQTRSISRSINVELSSNQRPRNFDPSIFEDESLSTAFESVRTQVDRITVHTMTGHSTLLSKVDYDEIIREQSTNAQLSLTLKQELIKVITDQLRFGLQALNNVWKIVCHVLQQLPALPTPKIIPARLMETEVPLQSESRENEMDMEDHIPRVSRDLLGEILPDGDVFPDEPPIPLEAVAFPLAELPVVLDLERVFQGYYIDGVYQDNSVLEVLGGWINDDPDHCTYEWSIKSPGNDEFVILEGENKKQYSTTTHDIGSILRCRIRHGSDDGSAETTRIHQGPPRIIGAVVTGGPYHTMPLEVKYTYTGGKEGISKYQWYSSELKKPYMPIPGATNRKYDITPDDFHTSLRVEVTPVRDDGIEGEPVIADVNPHFLTIDPEIAHQVETNVRLGKASFRVRMRSTTKDTFEPRTLLTSDDYIKIQKNLRTRLRIPYSSDLAAEIDRSSSTRFYLRDSSGTYTFEAENTRSRDIIVLVIRSYHVTRWMRQNRNTTEARSLQHIRATNYTELVKATSSMTGDNQGGSENTP